MIILRNKKFSDSYIDDALERDRKTARQINTSQTVGTAAALGGLGLTAAAAAKFVKASDKADKYVRKGFFPDFLGKKKMAVLRNLGNSKNKNEKVLKEVQGRLKDLKGKLAASIAEKRRPSQEIIDETKKHSLAYDRLKEKIAIGKDIRTAGKLALGAGAAGLLSLGAFKYAKGKKSQLPPPPTKHIVFVRPDEGKKSKKKNDSSKK